MVDDPPAAGTAGRAPTSEPSAAAAIDLLHFKTGAAARIVGPVDEGFRETRIILDSEKLAKRGLTAKQLLHELRDAGCLESVIDINSLDDGRLYLTCMIDRYSDTDTYLRARVVVIVVVPVAGLGHGRMDIETTPCLVDQYMFDSRDVPARAGGANSALISYRRTKSSEETNASKK